MIEELDGYRQWQWDRTNPDCQQEKHAACAGDAWDTETDERIACMCGCHPKEPK